MIGGKGSRYSGLVSPQPLKLFFLPTSFNLSSLNFFLPTSSNLSSLNFFLPTISNLSSLNLKKNNFLAMLFRMLKFFSQIKFLNKMLLISKELSLCHKLWLSNPFIFRTQCRRSLIFQTMTSARSNNRSLKYQSFTTLGSKEKWIRKPEFVAKTQFLCEQIREE